MWGVLITGGEDSSHHPISSVEMFVPWKDNLTCSLPSMKLRDTGHVNVKGNLRLNMSCLFVSKTFLFTPLVSHFSNPQDGKFHVDVFLWLQKVSPQSQPEHLLWRLGGRADQEDLRDLRPAGRLAQGGLPAGQEDSGARGLEDEIEKCFNRKAHWHPSHSPHEWQRHRSSDSQGKL